MKTPLVITVPNPFLKKPTKKVVLFDERLKKQIAKMLAVLRSEKGIGLAANQIGYDNNVILVEFEDPKGKENIPFTIIINPQIVEKSLEKEYFEEGCLSVPQIELDVERSSKIKVRYQNETGKVIKTAPKGLFARILQHEVDHLNGIIFTERIKEQFFAKFPNLENLKILFCGTDEFGQTILKGLILLGFNLEIITEKAKPAGRNQETRLTAVAEVAKKFSKKYYEVTLKALDSSSYDLIVCADFGKKIPNSILDLVKIAAINIHPSLLPKYRGPSPIQTSILNGEKETGVSIIKMTDKIDAGPVLAKVSTEISKNDNSQTLESRLATLGLKLLIKVLPDIVENRLKEMPQNEKEAFLTRKFTKADGEIDWEKSAAKIHAQIRAFYPWPGTYTFVDGKRLIIHKAHLEPLPLKPKTYQLVLDIVQVEGKKPMKFSEFLRGWRGKKPKWFGKIACVR